MGDGITIRDPIHRFISLNVQEAELVDTPAFQRLRLLRQLAFAYLVYPSALHTRFEHSLGVCHVAGLLAGRLLSDNDEIKLVRLAALLHDLGHGPFSHVSEEALEIYADRSKIGAKSDKIHELITATLIDQDPSVARLISYSEREKIKRVLSTGYGEPVLRAILSGPLDADKQDYLLRDSYFCGVQYGIFDLPQMHEVLCKVVDPTTGDHDLMVEPEGIHALEQFVLAEYYLTTQVIRHHVRLITDQMLVRAIALGIEKDEISELKAIYAYDGSYEFIQRYSTWGDAKFLHTFSAPAYEGKLSHRLFRGLADRRLLKRIYKTPMRQLAADSRQILTSISKQENREIRKRLESQIAERLASLTALTTGPAVDPSPFVIVHAYTVKSAKEQSKNDESSILINGVPPKLFESASTLFQSIDEKLSETVLEVYAPVSWATTAEKRALRQQALGPITEVLETAGKGSK